jgi:CCR4-NOT transcription complex subunit 1
LGNDDQLWKWVAQYLVMKRASIEPNFHSLYAGFINTVNVNILYDTVLSETHRNIKVTNRKMLFALTKSVGFRFFY